MKLSSLNNVLRKLGLVLVVQFQEKLFRVEDPRATHIWIERSTTYDKRIG